MLTNFLKSPILQWGGKWKRDPESVSGTTSPPKVNQFSTTTPSNPAHRQNDTVTDKLTYRITSASVEITANA